VKNKCRQEATIAKSIGLIQFRIILSKEIFKNDGAR